MTYRHLLAQLGLDELERSCAVLRTVTLVSRSVAAIAAVRVGCIAVRLDKAGVAAASRTDRPCRELSIT